jgi:hypothetical protein
VVAVVQVVHQVVAQLVPVVVLVAAQVDHLLHRVVEEAPELLVKVIMAVADQAYLTG